MSLQSSEVKPRLQYAKNYNSLLSQLRESLFWISAFTLTFMWIMHQRKSHVTKQSWKMREKPLPLPSNMRKINSKSTASSFLSTELQLLLFHDPVGHRWSWRPLRGWPPDWRAKFTITTATGCLWWLNKTTKMPLSWRSSQVFPVCSHGKAGFAHQSSEPGSCSTKGTGLWPLGSGDEPE